MQLKGKFNQLTRRVQLEYIALPVTIIAFLFIYHLKYYSYIFLMLAAVIGVSLFIVFNRYFVKQGLVLDTLELPDNQSHLVRMSLSILFCIFYGLSFLALLQGFYTKTIWYYIFISLCTGIIAIEILFVKTNAHGNLNLMKSFLLVLNITLSNQILFPYGIGLPDSNYHIFRLVIPIVNNGYIPSAAGTYANFPVHHILVAMDSLVVGANPQTLYYCLGGFVMSLGLLFVFLIGREFVNLKFGLFAALIYANCDYLISWASHPTHMTYTYFLAIMILAVTLYVYQKGDPRFIAFFTIIATTMVFSHHLSAMLILIVLVAIGVVEISQHVNYHNLQNKRDNSYKFRIPILVELYAIILFAHWMYHAHMVSALANIVRVYGDAFREEAENIAITTVYDELPIGTLFQNEIGAIILLSLSVIGFLYFFKHRSFFTDAVMGLTIVLLGLMSVEVFMKESYLEAHRIFALLQEFAFVFLASGAIIWILKNLSFKKYAMSMAIIVLLCLSFFSLSSSITGDETSPFVGDRAYYKLYETPYERYSDNWVEKYIVSNSSINSSWSFRCPLSNISYSKLPIKGIEDAQSKKELFIIDTQNITKDSFILFSKFDINIGVYYKQKAIGKYTLGSTSYIKLDKNASNSLDRYNQYYDNGMINIFY